MNSRIRSRWLEFGAAAWLALILGGPLFAQPNSLGQRTDSQGEVDIIGALSGGTAFNPARVSARFSLVEPAAARDRAGGGSRAVVQITARMQPGWIVYSISQPPGGPTRTQIQLAPSPAYRLEGAWRAHPQHASRIDREIWRGLEIQEHAGEVTWYAEVELSSGVDPANLEIRGEVNALACEKGGQCVPVNATFTARQGPTVAGLPAAAPQSPAGNGGSANATGVSPSIGASTNQSGPTFRGSYQAEDSVVRITGRLAPAAVLPGESIRLSITAALPPGWHIYANAERDPQKGSKPTLIAVEETAGGVLRFDRPVTFAPVIIDDTDEKFGEQRYHHGRVTWTIDAKVRRDAAPGEYPVNGIIGYMACEDRKGGTCELPRAVRFQTMLTVVEAAASQVPGQAGGELTFAEAPYPEAASAAIAFAAALAGQPPTAVDAGPANGGERITTTSTLYDLSRIRLSDVGGSLVYFMVLAFIGGLILNLMPCVLPVIGLKVMSFVEQAGRSRSHALALNAWYAAGIISVFLLLGALAAVLGLTWGGQFGNTTFNVIVAAVVFAMALSLLGVWEVPIPGFFGSGSVQEAAAQEGPLGAFLKGVVTTVLATPCTASFMAPAIAWAAAQSATAALVVFATLGLGMASPYLLVGVFPELLRFVPKPGAWMLTFKQLTGFILLGTVVFILSFIEPAAIVPTVLLLVGIGMACWLFARTPHTAEANERLQGWSLAGAVLLLFGVVSFGWLYPEVMWPRYGDIRSSAKEGWDPFSLPSLHKVAVEDGRTVIVDFSADWCANCKWLEKTVLDTEVVRQAIARTRAVPMYADYTKYPPEIADTIKALRGGGVPVIAIFPGSRPYEPIVFRGGYSQAKLIAALERATPQSADVASANP
jgi:thiol:disulfide interchange protein